MFKRIVQMLMFLMYYILVVIVIYMNIQHVTN